MSAFSRAFILLKSWERAQALLRFLHKKTHFLNVTKKVSDSKRVPVNAISGNFLFLKYSGEKHLFKYTYLSLPPGAKEAVAINLRPPWAALVFCGKGEAVFIRDLLGVPLTLRAARDAYGCLKKQPNVKRTEHNELQQPLKWKEELKRKGINAEIVFKKNQAPVVVYNQH